jgi:hypothetical protein
LLRWEVLDERKRQSLEGLRDVRSSLEQSSAWVETHRVAIYVTGSFGRLEARYPSGSDLDVFLLYAPGDEPRDRDLPRLVWFRLIAAVITTAADLKFPEFSRDGEFLNAHNVKRVGQQLGSRHEDADNGFTARLLLMLESQYLLNENLYDELLLETVGFYYGDFATNREGFRPHALVNDILRYWRTLCLNYEYNRNRRRSATDEPVAQTQFRASSALDNLKLRYSRLALCFSMIAVLASEPDGITSDRVCALCGLVPAERWTVAADRDPSGRAEEVVDHLLADYEQFLVLAADEQEILARLGNPEERKALRRRAAGFGDSVFELLRLVVPAEHFRRLVV